MSLIKEINSKFEKENTLPIHFGMCRACERSAEIIIRGYGTEGGDVLVCPYCALQLSRKLLEDVCDLNGGRHD